MNKEGSFKPIIFVMIASLLIAFYWNKVGFIKDAVHYVLDPSAGVLLNWNLTWGMLIIVLLIALITTLVQKYATDQEALRELKKEQKILQEEMKKYKEHPEKLMELQKKQFEFIPKTMKLSMRALAFTGIPFILFFRWFMDFFTAMEIVTGAPIKFLGFLTWFWFYLIFTMIFSGVLRKVMKVV
ncbi:MAG: EMC3/TMCO1 family protein [archaeon]